MVVSYPLASWPQLIFSDAVKSFFIPDTQGIIPFFLLFLRHGFVLSEVNGSDFYKEWSFDNSFSC